MNVIKNSKIWLTIIALMHTFMGVIIPIIQLGNGENLGVLLYFLIISVHLFYVILFTKGQNQARLGVILCAPVVGWFIISAIMKLEMYGFPIAEMPTALMPIVFWTMPIIAGLYNWNSNKNNK